MSFCSYPPTSDTTTEIQTSEQDMGTHQVTKPPATEREVKAKASKDRLKALLVLSIAGRDLPL